MLRKVGLKNSRTVTADRATQRAMRGVTLIEVLVSLIVISVGLLGVAALHMTSLRNSQGSHLRTQATVLANDIIDRMRANRTVALKPTYGYNIDFGATITVTASSSRADRDRADWKAALIANLPKTPTGGNPDGSIVVADNNIVTVRIRWGERDAANPIVFTTRTEI